MKYATYHAIQVVRNHECPEPVTIGVLVRCDKAVELRLIGSKEPGMHQTKGEFGHAFADLVDADLIYLQWVKWFERQVEEMQGNPDKVLQKLARLQDRGETVIASVTGQIPMGDDDTVQKVSDHLFAELVMVNPVMQRAKFQASIDYFFLVGELLYFGELIEDAEVELLDKDGNPKQLIHFPFLWNTKSQRKLAGMLISAYQSPREVSAAVANVMTTFEVAQNHKFISKDDCFVLVNDKLSDIYQTILKTKAEIIDITDISTSTRKIRDIFYR